MLKRLFLLSSTNRFILIVSLIVLLLGVTTLLYLKSQSIDFTKYDVYRSREVYQSKNITAIVTDIQDTKNEFKDFLKNDSDQYYQNFLLQTQSLKHHISLIRKEINWKYKDKASITPEEYQHFNNLFSKLYISIDTFVTHAQKVKPLNKIKSNFHIDKYKNALTFYQMLAHQRDSLQNIDAELNAYLADQKWILDKGFRANAENYYTYWLQYGKLINNKILKSSQIIDKQFDLSMKYSLELDLINKNIFNKNVIEERRSFVNSLEKFNLTARGLIMIIFVLCFIVIVNIRKLYSDEKKIIEYGKTVEDYATHNRDFLANMSHELRTPINSIIGFSEQLNQTSLDALQRSQLDSILSSSEMLLGTVNDILDFSKFETDKVILVNQIFSPHKLINEVVNSLQIQSVKKNIDLKIDIQFAEDIKMEADPFRVKQVILNLLSNAIKYTAENGKVLLTANLRHFEGDIVHLACEIKDSGIGISQQHQRHIFEKFTQISTKENSEWQNGTGLGLAICKKIVNLFGGDIFVKSELGKGSTFSFYMPIKLINGTALLAKPILAQEISELPFQRLSNIRLLFVDDNQMNVKLGSMILNKYAVDYDTAINGVDALEKYLHSDYDIIVSDVQMPILDGMELTKRIRALKNGKGSVKILGLTANVLQEDIKRYMSIGMDDVITKPYTEKDFISKVISMV